MQEVVASPYTEKVGIHDFMVAVARTALSGSDSQ